MTNMPQLLDETLDNILQHGSDIDILKAVGLAQSFILKVKYKKLSETDLEALSEREPYMRDCARARLVEQSERLSRRDRSKVGVCSGTIVAGNALLRVIVKCSEIP